jgi:hypothetical protein
MAKQKISSQVQSKFEKAQFKVGDIVCFSWLGQKQYGYVKKLKTRNWGIQYNVLNYEKVTYPCGIKIGDSKTQYVVGYIFWDETRALSTDELVGKHNHQIESRTIARISEKPRGTSIEKSDDGKIRRPDTPIVSEPIKQDVPRKPSRKDAASIASGSNRKDYSRRRKSTPADLEDAIQKQRDFLNGFVKKD